MNTHTIEAAKHYIHEIFKDNSDGHDEQHSLRVYRNALKIAENYPECNKRIIALASLLHDVDDHKLFDTKDNGNAVRFLQGQHVDDNDIALICEIINGVSFSRNKDTRPESIEGKIVQDADRLDAIGAIGIARTFAYGGRAGRSLESSIQHFHEKLLLLKDKMNTKEAKEMAKIRHSYMEEFLAEFHKETEPCNEQIRRIEKYEKIMREAGRIIEGFSKGEEEILRDLTNELESYYGSDEWKQDFADDEAGLLPAKLARGVLSEDGIYNLLERSKELLHSKTSFPKYSGQ